MAQPDLRSNELDEETAVEGGEVSRRELIQMRKSLSKLEELDKAISELKIGETRSARKRLKKLEKKSNEDKNYSAAREWAEVTYRKSLASRFTGSLTHLLFEATEVKGEKGKGGGDVGIYIWHKYHGKIKAAVKKKAIGRTEKNRNLDDMLWDFPEKDFFQWIASTPLEDLYILEAVFEALEEVLTSEKETQKVERMKEGYKTRMIDDVTTFFVEEVGFFEGKKGAGMARLNAIEYYQSNPYIISQSLERNTPDLPKSIRPPKKLNRETVEAWLDSLDDSQLYWAGQIWMGIKEILRKKMGYDKENFRRPIAPKFLTYLGAECRLQGESSIQMKDRHRKLLEQLKLEKICSVNLPEDLEIETWETWVNEVDGVQLYHMQGDLERARAFFKERTDQQQREINRIGENFMSEGGLVFLLEVMRERGSSESDLAVKKINNAWAPRDGDRPAGYQLMHTIGEVKAKYPNFPENFVINGEWITQWLTKMDYKELAVAEGALKVISIRLNEQAKAIETDLRYEILNQFNLLSYMEEQLTYFEQDPSQAQDRLYRLWIKRGAKTGEILPPSPNRAAVEEWIETLDGTDLLIAQKSLWTIGNEIQEDVEQDYRQKLVREFFEDANVIRLRDLIADPDTKQEAEDFWERKKDIAGMIFVGFPTKLEFNGGSLMNWLNTLKGEKLKVAQQALLKLRYDFNEMRRGEILEEFYRLSPINAYGPELCNDFWQQRGFYIISAKVRSQLVGRNDYPQPLIPHKLDQFTLTQWITQFEGVDILWAEWTLSLIQVVLAEQTDFSDTPPSWDLDTPPAWGSMSDNRTTYTYRDVSSAYTNGMNTHETEPIKRSNDESEGNEGGEENDFTSANKDWGNQEDGTQNTTDTDEIDPGEPESEPSDETKEMAELLGISLSDYEAIAKLEAEERATEVMRIYSKMKNLGSAYNKIIRKLNDLKEGEEGYDFLYNLLLKMAKQRVSKNFSRIQQNLQTLAELQKSLSTTIDRNGDLRGQTTVPPNKLEAAYLQRILTRYTSEKSNTHIWRATLEPQLAALKIDTNMVPEEVRGRDRLDNIKHRVRTAYQRAIDIENGGLEPNKTESELRAYAKSIKEDEDLKAVDAFISRALKAFLETIDSAGIEGILYGPETELDTIQKKWRATLRIMPTTTQDQLIAEAQDLRERKAAEFKAEFLRGYAEQKRILTVLYHSGNVRRAKEIMQAIRNNDNSEEIPKEVANISSEWATFTLYTLEQARLECLTQGPTERIDQMIESRQAIVGKDLDAKWVDSTFHKLETELLEDVARAELSRWDAHPKVGEVLFGGLELSDLNPEEENLLYRSLHVANVRSRQRSSSKTGEEKELWIELESCLGDDSSLDEASLKKILGENKKVIDELFLEIKKEQLEIILFNINDWPELESAIETMSSPSPSDQKHDKTRKALALISPKERGSLIQTMLDDLASKRLEIATDWISLQAETDEGFNIDDALIKQLQERANNPMHFSSINGLEFLGQCDSKFLTELAKRLEPLKMESPEVDEGEESN